MDLSVSEFEEVVPVRNPITDVFCMVARSGHCMVADESDLYVFGGFNPSQREYSATSQPGGVLIELWKFNFASKIWSRLESEGIPDTCASACMKMWRKRLCIYGGTGFPFGKMLSNTIKICDCTKKNSYWYLVETNPNVYNALDTGDHMPPRAYGQSLVFHNDSMYVFAGAIGFYEEPVSDLHRLNLRTLTWERLKPGGDVPTGRYKQEVAVDSKRFYVFGGGRLHYAEKLATIHAYSFDRNVWENLDTSPDPLYGYPWPRSSFGLVQVQNNVYICGGRHYSPVRKPISLSDLWKFSFETFQWKRLSANFPESVYFHTMAVCPSGYLYVFGGIGGVDERRSKLFQYRLPFDIPRLSELSWKRVTQTLRNIEKMKKEDFIQLGIPFNFYIRISWC